MNAGCAHAPDQCGHRRHVAEYNWVFRAIGTEPSPITGPETEIVDLADGAYRIEWRDTYKGESTKTEEKETKGGRPHLELPTIQSDVACKIKRVR